MPAANASSPLCTVRNLSTTTVYTGSGSNLHTAINAANSGATLQIQGVCVGNFFIGNNLALKGKRSKAFRTPRLDGNNLGTVLTVSAGSVSIDNIRITNGFSSTSDAAGIQNGGNLTLNGDTTVTGNAAAISAGFGGILNFGTLTMNGHASVTHNPGGGIGNGSGGTFTMNGSSSVADNPGLDGTYGSGIWNVFGTVTLNAKASVVGNSSTSVSFVAGAGIYSYGGQVTLNDSTKVTGNSTTGDGGGALIDGGAIFTMNGSSMISGNTAASGGGIYDASGTLVGAVAGGNVLSNNPDDIAP